MSGLIFIAMTEIVTALIIWLLIEVFFHVGETRGKLRSLGVFLTVWAAAVALHIYFLSPNERHSVLASETTAKTEDDVNIKDIATFEANTPELQSIIKRIIAGEALDQRTHDHFWSLIPTSLWSTADRRQGALSGLDKIMPFQRAFWQSALLSAQTHQVVKTQAYEQALHQAGLSSNTEGDAMLQAAASGAPYTLSSGQGTIVINEAYAHQVLSNLDASSTRLKNLFDPSWRQ